MPPQQLPTTFKEMYEANDIEYKVMMYLAWKYVDDHADTIRGYGWGLDKDNSMIALKAVITLIEKGVLRHRVDEDADGNEGVVLCIWNFSLKDYVDL